MALSRDLPQSFGDALRVSRKMLSARADLVVQDLLDTESEQLVLAAYRQATGHNLNRIELFVRIMDRFPEAAGERLILLSGSRAEGKLLQHLIGYQVFLDHEYEVGPDVLVPRPETEVLLRFMTTELATKESHPRLGFEIGIGSGIISIELLSHFPLLKMMASELSPLAIERAKKNALRILGPSSVDRLQVMQVSAPLEVWAPFQAQFQSQGVLADFIVTNPPYLLRSDEVEAQVMAYEPHEALFAPVQDPLYFYRVIAEQSQKYLKPRGFVFAELPHERASEILRLFSILGWEAKVQPDLSQRDRVLIAQLK
jgi:release factor glutamine methyltransferase